MKKFPYAVLIVAVLLLLVPFIAISASIMLIRPTFDIYYWADYDSRLDIVDVQRAFLDNEITIYRLEIAEEDPEYGVARQEVIAFRFAESGSGDPALCIEGWLANTWAIESGTSVDLELCDEKYPRTPTENEAWEYQPTLEKASDFLEDVLFDATGVRPSLSGFSVMDNIE